MLSSALAVLLLLLHPLVGLGIQTPAPAASGPPAILVDLLPIIIGGIAMPLYAAFKRAWAWLGTKAPEWVHPILVSILTVLLAHLATVFHLNLSTPDFGSLTGTDVTGLLGAIAAWIINHIWKSTPSGSGGTSTLAGKTASTP